MLWNKIYKNLFDKTSMLVERTKQSRFLGFFSPRRLRKRIKLGNFSQIPWNFIVSQRRAFSPNFKLSNLIHESKTVNHESNTNWEKNTFMNTCNPKSFNKYTYSRASKLKKRLEKFIDSKWNEKINVDDDIFQAQQKIISNFRMTSKLILT